MLVKFSCGCIGFDDVHDKEGRLMVVETCDDRGIFTYRDMTDKTAVPVTADASERLFTDLIHDIGRHT